MYIDGENELSLNQAITASANSEDIIDTTKARDIGTGEPFYVSLTVTEAFTDADSNSTVTVNLATDSDSAFGSPTVVQPLVTLPALTPAGTQLYFRVHPENLVAFERYIGLTYVVANGNLTTGKISASLVRNIQKANEYPASGYTVY